MRIVSIKKVIRRKGVAIGRPSIQVDIASYGHERPISQVVKDIRDFKACSRVVFTGNDPLVEQLAILDVISHLQQGWEIIVETTGGIMPDLFLRERVSAWEVNIPPEGSVFPFSFNDDAIRFYATQKNATFEWPVKGEQDLIEVKKTVFAYNIPWKRVILSPDTEWSDDQESTQKLLSWLEEFCLEKGCSIGNPIIKRENTGGAIDADDQRDTGLPGEEPQH